jgi:hypothetical protein
LQEKIQGRRFGNERERWECSPRSVGRKSRRGYRSLPSKHNRAGFEPWLRVSIG